MEIKRTYAATPEQKSLNAQELEWLRGSVAPGSPLYEALNAYIAQLAAIPANVGYRGFPKTVCTSVNHVICHGIPSDRALKDGDIVNIDVTPLLDGWHGDSSRMYLVGDVPLKARRLVEVTYECLMLGIAQAKPGKRLGDIGAAHKIREICVSAATIAEAMAAAGGRTLDLSHPPVGIEDFKRVDLTAEDPGAQLLELPRRP